MRTLNACRNLARCSSCSVPPVSVGPYLCHLEQEPRNKGDRGVCCGKTKNDLQRADCEINVVMTERVG